MLIGIKEVLHAEEIFYYKSCLYSRGFRETYTFFVQLSKQEVGTPPEGSSPKIVPVTWCLIQGLSFLDLTEGTKVELEEVKITRYM